MWWINKDGSYMHNSPSDINIIYAFVSSAMLDSA